MLDRKTPPKIVDAIDFDLKLRKCQKFTLKNGAEVYAIDAGAEEVMMVELVYFAGNWMEEQNLIASATNFLLRNGTSTKTAFQINEHFEYYGSYLNRHCYNETSTISLHCLTKHVRELLPLVKELLTDSVMPENELAIYKQNAKQSLKVNLKKSDFVANRLIDSYLYGKDHPYGKYSDATDFDNLNRDQLVDFYKTFYQKGKFILFVAGRLPKDLEQILNNNFGDLSNNAVSLKKISVHPASEKKYRVTNDAEGVQGSIRISRQFPNRHHPDFLKAQVLNCLFGGFFGSRLMNNIREDKGYTYNIYSYLHNHIHESGWSITTEAGRDVCEAAITEIYKEMKTLQEELVDDEELLLVKNYLSGGILGDLDGPFQIISRWKNIILNNLTEKYFYDTIHTIKTVSAEELRQLAQKYFNPEDFYELIVV